MQVISNPTKDKSSGEEYRQATFSNTNIFSL